jgi:hypothetical protein
VKQVVDAVKKYTACKHEKAAIFDQVNSWCPDCGALKSGPVWTHSALMQLVIQFKQMFGL